MLGGPWLSVLGLSLTLELVQGPPADWVWWFSSNSSDEVEEVFPDATVGETAPPRMAPEEGERSAPHAGDANLFAHVWGHSVFHFDIRSWMGPAWFSTPQQKGSLSSSGGWGLYFLDRFGLATCGEFWPWIAWGTLLALITVLTIGVIYALTWVFRPIRLLFDCCTRHTQAVAREVSDLLPELQATHTYESLAIRGPGSRESVDNDFLQKGVKGRGTERKPNDAVLLLNGQAARVKPDCDHWARVDRNGLWVRLREVRGVSHRNLRQVLEGESKVHLCREMQCSLENHPTPGIHCKTYAVVDANSVVDLGAYAGWSTRRLMVLFTRCFRSVGRSVWKMVGVLSGWTLLRYLMDTPQPTRTIQDHGGLRTLDPESESEAEVLEDPCEAVLVGLTHGGKPRALANEPCRDQAAGESVRLLECDKGLSDVKGRQAVRLCDHHRQLYVAACSGRKCSVLSCYESHDGAKQGVPLCKHHLMDVGSSVRSKRKVTWESDGSNPEAEEPSSGVEGHFEDQRGVSPQARSSRPKRRAATSHPKARASSAGPQSQFQHQAEGRLLQGPCISLIRFKSLQNGESLPRWVAFLGRVTGVATSSRAQEKVEIDIPALKVQGVVHLSQLRPPPGMMDTDGFVGNGLMTSFKPPMKSPSGKGFHSCVVRSLKSKLSCSKHGTAR